MKKQILSLKELLTLKLERLVSILEADFAAIAFYDPINSEFRWRLATGSLNNRYTSIVVRSGKGICGRVLKTMREFIITQFPEELEDEFLEFPILIVEELKSSVAVPLIFQNQLIGVLLIGQRTHRKFKPNEVDGVRKVSEEIVLSYTQERKAEPVEEKKEIKQSSLSHYFFHEKALMGERVKIVLLDQRITLLSEQVQQNLISIFIFLFNYALVKENKTVVKVIIELKSEQQFSIQIEVEPRLEFTEEVFSKLADKVRLLKGNINLVFENEKTILTMNFFFSMLIDDDF